VTTEFLAGRDGHRLAADVAGPPDGPPVILLHGGGQTRHSWGTTAAVLAERGWRAFSVDLRGHGDSDWAADGDYTMEAFAGDVTAIASSMDRSPALVGASLGGLASLAAVGWWAAGPGAGSGHPLATALVLVDVAPRTEEAGRDRIGAFMMENMEDGFGSLDEVADAIARYNPHRPRPQDLSGLKKNLRERDGRWFWHWDPSFIRGSFGSPDETRTSIIDPTSLEAAARNVTIPVLVVRGRVSDLLSEEGAQELLRLVPHGELVSVEGAGHMVAGDRNDLFNDSVVGFLERAHIPPPGS
jgi:pimeloyl-ACP methyl ester carboxylesterase